jgi:hypothetical protein
MTEGKSKKSKGTKDEPKKEPEPRKKRPTRPDQELATIQGLADENGVPPTSIRDLIHRGVLPVVQFPGSRRQWIRRSQWRQLIETSTERAS